MDLSDLYQELILDHNRSPRNRRHLENASRSAMGYNPLCGDKVKIEVMLDEQGKIIDIAFEGSGCAISTASASLMTEAVKGKTPEEVKAIHDTFHGEVTEMPVEGNGRVELGKLVALTGVRKYPARVKCATLAWHTLKAALDQVGDTVTTE